MSEGESGAANVRMAKNKGKASVKGPSKVEKGHGVRAKSRNGEPLELLAAKSNLANDNDTRVCEQQIVAENLHQSQAKIAVVGLSEMQ
eukprot:COSAG02_NODE_17182_length_1023_cov_0.623377_1_plen_88_part_00